jgi:hypothetical protein
LSIRSSPERRDITPLGLCIERQDPKVVSLFGRTAAFLTIGGDLSVPIVERRDVGKAAEALK